MADTIKDLQKVLQKYSKQLQKKSGQLETVVASDLLARMKRRIFNAGQASDGGKIGDYSTKDILIGAKSFRTPSQASKQLGSKKKRANFQWRRVKGNNLAILPGGYKELRSIQGLRTDTVNLQYRDDLFRDFVQGISNGSVVLGVVTDLSRKKIEGNESRFGKAIFDITSQESKAIDRAVKNELDKILLSL